MGSYNSEGRWVSEMEGFYNYHNIDSSYRPLSLKTDSFGEANGGGGNRKEKSKTSFWKATGRFLRELFSGNKGAGISMIVPGATISRVSTLEIGSVTFRGILSSASLDAVALGISRVGLWSLPLMLNGDSSHASGYDIPLTGAIDVPVTTTADESEPDQMITLYRGVCIGHYDYKNALQGRAVPLGGHSDPKLHNWGDTESIFTSWTTNENVAAKFANKNGGGVILKKSFYINETVPSPDKYNEQEVLIPGIVIGAIPTIVKRK